MQTEISVQIRAIQNARTYLESRKKPNDASNVIAIDNMVFGLNDAGSTLAALNMAQQTINKLKTVEEKKEQALKFFEFFNSLER